MAAAPAEDPRVARGMERQLELRRERLAADGRSLGWKLGLGTAAAMGKLGIPAPLVGYLLADAQLGDGATCDITGWAKPTLEPEIAVHLAADVGPDATPDEVAAAVAGLGPAIELVDIDAPPADPEEILAGDIFQRHVVLGPADPAIRTAEGLGVRVSVNGDEAASSPDAQALTGDVLGLVAHVARTLGAHGERLRAGEVVIAGSAVPAITPAPGDAVEVEIVGLGALSVRF